MPYIYLEDQWMPVADYEANADGVLLACHVKHPAGTDYHLIARLESMDFNEWVRLVSLVASFAGVSYRIADVQTQGNKVAAFTAGLVGGTTAFWAFTMTMKEPGYYDITSKRLVHNRLIAVADSSAFRTT